MRRLAIVLSLLAACGDDDGVTADAAPPCTLPAEGICEGAVAQHCVNEQLVSQDCAAEMGFCAFIDTTTGHGCTNQCELEGVTPEGVCTADGVRSCEIENNQFAVVIETCTPGTTCVQPAGAVASCAADPCFAVGPQGRCNGDTLTECAAGVSTDTDCSLMTKICTYVDNATGYACVDPATTGAFQVTGTIRYEDRPPLLNGGLGELTPLPARGVTVAVVADVGGAVLATGMTSDDGTYTLNYDATMGDQVHILASTVSTLPSRPARVTKGIVVHGFGGASFAADTAVVSDVLVIEASTEKLAEAFNVFDQPISGCDFIRTQLGDDTPQQVSARWSRNSNDGTYYSGDGVLHLLGANSDDDGYDDTVILHEFGHYVEDTQGRSDSPGGGHNGEPTDPRLAWSEGFSTYWNMAVRGQPYYMDSNANGGWSYDGDATIDVTPVPAGSMDQDVSEDMISEILWDIGDGATGDDDPFFGAGHGPVVRVQTLYLKIASLRGVGVSGVDLVDFLDGWFAGEGLGGCAGVRGVVTTTHQFPYDYAGPGGMCPP